MAKIVKQKNTKDLVIYQAKSGKIEFHGDINHETIWGNLNQIAELFGVQKSAISKHLKNIYKDRELNRKATVSILETVQDEGSRQIKRKIEYFNLDAMLSVGYRVNSNQATQFRIWATSVLKQHLLEGYTINKKRINDNYQKFLRAVDDLKILLPSKNKLQAEDVLDLINVFASTWFSLSSYDSNNLPQIGVTKKRVDFTADELAVALAAFKKDLLAKKLATDIFGKERSAGALQGIVGNIFQSFDKKDLYITAEEKAAHLLYFIIKNHPFVDGNKRSGAFAFIWFLRRINILQTSFTPQALTALALLIAESNPRDKSKMIGLIILMLKR